MKHDRKKPWRLLLYMMLPLLLSQCAPEESMVTTAEAGNYELKTRIVSLEEIEKMPGIMEILNSLAPGKNKRLAYSEKYEFSVETEQVLVVEKGKYKSLSFPISRAVPAKNLENLFLHPHKGGYLPFLASYNFSTPDLINLRDGKPIDDLMLKVRLTPLNQFDLDTGVVYNENGYTSGASDPSYTGTIININGECYRPHNFGSAGQPDWGWILCSGCECPVPTGDGADSGPGVVVQQYYAIIDLIGGSSGSSSGGPGGPGSGGGGGHTKGGFTTPFNPVQPEEVDPNAPQTDGFYNPNPIIGLLSPNRPNQKERLRQLTENKKDGSITPIKAKIDELKSRLDTTNGQLTFKEDGAMYNQNQDELEPSTTGGFYTHWYSHPPNFYITLHMHQNQYYPSGSINLK
ncbi:hypothetical protein, partial [uncultured Flavobacterium sp.]|uniref:hypothetical protein n=1 Tax=uncultured Flavobacterium sp. TaxID=165435 RepID=UPI0025DA9171